MMWLLLPLAPVAFLLAAHLLMDVVAYPLAIRAFRKLPLYDDVRDAAINCFVRARHAERRTWWADCTAPVIVPIALLFTKRSANNLPCWAKPWENNVSINGDSGGTLLENGQWMQWRDTPQSMWTELYGRPQLDYSHTDYSGDAYYCRGFHPRSFIARYVWLGWRNRASALAVKHGADIPERPSTVASGDGWTLRKAGDLYQWQELRGGKICVRRNMGYKLNLLDGKDTGRAAATAIWFSLRRGE